MRVWILPLLILSLIGMASPARAEEVETYKPAQFLPQYRHHTPSPQVRKATQHRSHRAAGHRHSVLPPPFGGIVKVGTAAGPIYVAQSLAGNFKALIDDFAAAGYIPRNIGCYAATGHVPGSWHHVGAACDFNQHGWGLTDPFMYTAIADSLIRKHGFTNGCQFHDCGHVGIDGQRRRSGHGHIISAEFTLTRNGGHRHRSRHRHSIEADAGFDLNLWPF